MIVFPLESRTNIADATMIVACAWNEEEYVYKWLINNRFSALLFKLRLSFVEQTEVGKIAIGNE